MEDCLKRVRISNNAIIDGRDLWLVSNYTNVLMHYDIGKGDLKQIYFFPEKFIDIYFTISYEKVENKIYFAPYNGKNLWCFHIPTSTFEIIDLNLRNTEKNIKQKFRAIFRYKHELILIGFSIHSIFRIDIATNTVKRFDEYLTELRKMGITVEDSFLGYSYQLVGDVLYLPMLDHNIIIAFCLFNNNFKIYDISDLDSNGLDSIEYYNGEFRLLTNENEEVIWNCKCGLQSEIRLNLIETHKRNYWRTFRNSDTFIYFPLFDPNIYVKKKGMDLETIPFLYPEQESYRDASKYEFIKKKYEKIYFQVRSNGNCYYIDFEQMLIKPLDLKPPDFDTYKKIMKKIFGSIDEDKIYESEVVNIESFLCFSERFQQKETVVKNKKYGDMIYKSL